tara:strand:- start:40 stop:429 length:390 start_codon:yes stop_codon:yes gene_type:complete
MSEILVNKLTGKTTANDITVTDGSVTFKMQDSLIKHWTIVDQSGTTQSLGSFNQSSLTDVGVGRTNLTFTNNFASASAQCITAYNSYSVDGSWYQLISTASYRLTAYMQDASTYYDVDHYSGQITGDLA